jgi:uncharacterized protein (DUF1684 family)
MRRLVIGLTCTCLAACTLSTEGRFDAEAHRKEIEQWQKKRNAYQVSESGWVNLAGLFWLKEGINTFGSGTDNDLVFPEGKIPEHGGYLLLNQNEVTLEGAPGLNFSINGRSVSRGVISQEGSSRSMVQFGPLRWSIIKRGDQFGVRLRDLESPLLKEFHGIDCFPIDPAWRIKGNVEWADSSRTIEITNVLGQTGPQRSVATLVFTYEGEDYRLDALDEGGDEFFIIFGDDTNAVETYGAGRYLYVPIPKQLGKEVTIDFNKAYNPPCAFTEFATCPLPPQQNILPFSIRAGEKNYGTH